MVSKQKDNNEGFNKHTRRVIDNNSGYLHRNMARQFEVKDAKMKKEVANQGSPEIVRSGRSQVDGAELIRREEEAELTRIEEEEASGREKMKVTRVSSPDKIFLQTPGQAKTAEMISRLLEEKLSSELHPTLIKMKMNANPEPSLEVGGHYAARCDDKWLRVTVFAQIPGNKEEVTILLADYHIYRSSYPVLHIYDLPESLDFSVIPATVR